MRSTKTQKNKGVVFAAIILILVLSGVAVYVSSNNKTKDSVTTPTTSQNDSNQTSIINNTQEQTEDFSKFKVYLSIADSPSDKFISKSYKDINSVKADTLIQNAPSASGSCTIDLYSLQGVEVHKLNTYTFNVNKSSSTGSALNFGAGTFRVEITCDFGGKRYSENYTVQILISKSVIAPVSYSN